MPGEQTLGGSAAAPCQQPFDRFPIHLAIRNGVVAPGSFSLRSMAAEVALVDADRDLGVEVAEDAAYTAGGG